MESLPLVCYSTGTMNSLVDKLAKMKLSNATEEFSNLTQEFEKAVLSLKEDFLDKLSVPKVCMKQVRELVFKIEDWVDQKRESIMLDPSDTKEIQNFLTEIKETRGRFTSYYDLLKIVPTEPGRTIAAPSKITINPRLLVEEKPCHGLLDRPIDELVKHLTDEKEEMRKVVSVVGMEGLGKTTLAKEIYSELQLRQLFNCQAFVSVGRRRPMREALDDILRQVKPWSMKLHIRADVQEVITELRDHLGTKRYFIVVDGIWSIWAWKVINCALPNNRGSRVMTTTCIMDVGRSCCSHPNDLVYQMEALNKENSRILFLSKTIYLQEEEKGAGFEEDSGYMVNLCGGMPLAMIVAAGLLLARKSEARVETRMIGESIHSLSKQYSTSEWMTKILHMSYADLSLPLRSCFMYLSVVPENYIINKYVLIRLWGAEGFIPRIDKECLSVTGERYFNDLISRRLIQPLFDFDDDQAAGCTIHGVILDFIRSVSREENFATCATELKFGPFPCGTIRRLSVDYRNEDEVDTLSTSSIHLSAMRSLIVVGNENGMHPYIPESLNILSAFKLLRVLHVQTTNCNLEGIGGLVLLRYLGLSATGIARLPEDTGELEQLETLDLRWNGLITFPASMIKLQKLTHLLLDVDITEFWEMPELEEASGIQVKSSRSLGKVVELLRKSERLRMLGLTLKESIPTETDIMSFIDEVVKSKLQSLSLGWNCGDKEIALLVDSWKRVTAHLGKQIGPRRFELWTGHRHLDRVPPNMCSLASLTHLHILLSNAKAEDLHVLGGLTNLVFLELTAEYKCSNKGSIIVTEGIFPCLKVFFFRVLHSWMALEFKQGSMPQIQMLRRGFLINEREDQEYLDVGMEHLTCLKLVYAEINCELATVSAVEAVENAIRAQVSQIPTKPTLELVRILEYSMRNVEQGQHSLTEETSIQQVEDDDQIRELEGQHSFPSKKEVSRNAEKLKVHRRISSLFKNLMDLGRQLIALPKASKNSNKHKLESSIQEEDLMKKDEGKHSISYNKTSFRESHETQVTDDEIV